MEGRKCGKKRGREGERVTWKRGVDNKRGNTVRGTIGKEWKCEEVEEKTKEIMLVGYD